MVYCSKDRSITSRFKGHVGHLVVLCSLQTAVATDAETWSLVDTLSVVCTASVPAAPGSTVITLPGITTVNMPHILSFYFTSNYATTITLKLEDSSSAPKVMVPQETVALDTFVRRRLGERRDADEDALPQAEKFADPSDWFKFDEDLDDLAETSDDGLVDQEDVDERRLELGRPQTFRFRRGSCLS